MVSIIIPNYNKGVLMRRCFDGLIAQTSENWEAIVVDDCSTDDSWAVIQSYVEKDSRIRAYRNATNRGGCYSRNFGAKMSKGEYLIFLDSDDWLSGDCIEVREREFNAEVNRDVEMLVFPMGNFRDGRVISERYPRARKDAVLRFLSHSMPWTIMMPIWRRSAFERVGGFDEAFPRLQDVELHARALLRGVTYRIANRDSVDCYYFVDSDRMTMTWEGLTRKGIKAMSLFVAKLQSEIDNAGIDIRKRSKALRVSVLAAVRRVGDRMQAKLIGAKTGDELLQDILNLKFADRIVRFYVWAYSHKINKVKGFNRLFNRISQFI